MIGILKKIIGKIGYWNRKIALFQWHENIAVVHNPLYAFVEVKAITDVIFSSGLFPLDDYEDRFSNGHIFCGLQNSELALVAYGWRNDSGTHYLGELNLEMMLPKNITVLYDFYTFEAFRGNGLYSNLLECICASDDKSKLIYAFPSNTNSCKGILKAHFKALGTISGFTKNNYFKLIQ